MEPLMVGGKELCKTHLRCYLNESGEIVTDLNKPLSVIPQEEVQLYFDLLMKMFSEILKNNLIILMLSTQQVADINEHRLLMFLWDSKL